MYVPLNRISPRPHTWCMLLQKNAQLADMQHVARFPAEREGFEPPTPRGVPVFKTGVIDHSTISPFAWFAGAKVVFLIGKMKRKLIFLRKLLVWRRLGNSNKFDFARLAQTLERENFLVTSDK